jgi:hypothetical protein
MGYSIDNVIFEYNRQAFKGTRSYTEEAQSYTGKFLTWPRPLRYQGRFATKAASLPRPLRLQNQTEINHEDHEGHEVFFFILHALHVLHG